MKDVFVFFPEAPDTGLRTLGLGLREENELCSLSVLPCDLMVPPLTALIPLPMLLLSLKSLRASEEEAEESAE